VREKHLKHEEIVTRQGYREGETAGKGGRRGGEGGWGWEEKGGERERPASAKSESPGAMV